MFFVLRPRRSGFTFSFDVSHAGPFSSVPGLVAGCSGFDWAAGDPLSSAKISKLILPGRRGDCATHVLSQQSPVRTCAHGPHALIHITYRPLTKQQQAICLWKVWDITT